MDGARLNHDPPSPWEFVSLGRRGWQAPIQDTRTLQSTKHCLDTTLGLCSLWCLRVHLLCVVLASQVGNHLAFITGIIHIREAVASSRNLDTGPWLRVGSSCSRQPSFTNSWTFLLTQTRFLLSLVNLSSSPSLSFSLYKIWSEHTDIKVQVLLTWAGWDGSQHPWATYADRSSSTPRPQIPEFQPWEVK